MQFNYKNTLLKFRLFAVLLLISTLGITSFSAHKYYSSITKIEIDQDEKLVKVYTQVFVDDFEELLKERYDLEINDFNKISISEKKQIEIYLLRKVKMAAAANPGFISGSTTLKNT